VVELIAGPSIAAASTTRGARADDRIVSAPAVVTITVHGEIVSEPRLTG
jgi:hypothetical protein